MTRRDPIWHPRVGPGIRVSEMTDEHIDNALAYLTGRAASLEVKLARMASINFYNGSDQRQYKSELEDRAEDSYYWIKVFEDEQRRRCRNNEKSGFLNKFRRLK